MRPSAGRKRVEIAGALALSLVFAPALEADLSPVAAAPSLPRSSAAPSPRPGPSAAGSDSGSGSDSSSDSSSGKASSWITLRLSVPPAFDAASPARLEEHRERGLLDAAFGRALEPRADLRPRALRPKRTFELEPGSASSTAPGDDPLHGLGGSLAQGPHSDPLDSPGFGLVSVDTIFELTWAPEERLRFGVGYELTYHGLGLPWARTAATDSGARFGHGAELSLHIDF